MLFVLDRDGVINQESEDYIKSPDEWIPIPGSIEAMALLSKKHRLVIATNQSGVNRGLYSLETLQNIHQKMITLVENAGGKIEKIYFCPHRPDERCICRKPMPGMLQHIQRDFQISQNEWMMVGDSLRDLEAATTMKMKFILVRTGNGKKTEKKLTATVIPLIFDDLWSFAQYVETQRI